VWTPTRPRRCSGFCARHLGAYRHEVRVRDGPLRRLHPCTWTGKPVRLVQQRPPRLAAGKKITTIEGLGNLAPWARRCRAAWAALDVPQCGYCKVGQIIERGRAARRQPQAHRGETIDNPRWQATSARCGDLSAHPRRHPSGAGPEGSVTWNRSAELLAPRFPEDGRAAAGGALLLGVTANGYPSLARPGSRRPRPSMPNAWVKIGSDDSITILFRPLRDGPGRPTPRCPRSSRRSWEVDLAKIKVEIAPAGAV